MGYAQRGWRVFRIPAGKKIPRDRWKHGTEWEVATTDVVEIERRLQNGHGSSNIGIATGAGLAVLDIDPQHGGIVPSWAPATLVAKTPSGGVHLYYAVDGAVQNSQGKLGPGIDVRGDGGMVLAPPSFIGGPSGQGWDVTKHNGVYQWHNPDAPLAQVSAQLLTPSGRDQSAGPRLALREFGAGERHDAMLTLAGKMRAIGCEYPEILAALQALNRTRFTPVLEDEWVVKVAKSIMRYAPDEDLLP